MARSDSRPGLRYFEREALYPGKKLQQRSGKGKVLIELRKEVDVGGRASSRGGTDSPVEVKG